MGSFLSREGIELVVTLALSMNLLLVAAEVARRISRIRNSPRLHHFCRRDESLAKFPPVLTRNPPVEINPGQRRNNRFAFP